MLEGILYILYGILLGVAGVMARQLRFAIKHFTPPVYISEIGEEVDMPSVTVCIPARNEMHAVAACLDKVIASDYQRLEIIVLDDASNDETSSLIKAYAHEGVRFVSGHALPTGWLGKNHALKGLLKEASGSYVLFMDVDTRIAPNAVSNLVRYTLSKRATMVSVLPRREDGWRGSVIFSPLRYFWELMFHRTASPATASNAWMIHRQIFLDQFNGFENLKTVVQPESFVATELSKTDSYRFLMSTREFGIAYEKKWRSQLATSTRLLFPSLNNKIAVALVAVCDLLFLLAPTVLLVLSFFMPLGYIQLCVGAIVLLYASIYGAYAHRVWAKGWLLGALLWPLLLVQECILIGVSVVKYKRHTVTWKGRGVLQGREFKAKR